MLKDRYGILGFFQMRARLESLSIPNQYSSLKMTHPYYHPLSKTSVLGNVPGDLFCNSQSKVVLTPRFLTRGRHLSSDVANLYKDLVFPRAPKPNRFFSRSSICRIIIRHSRCQFSASVIISPPTWARVEPANLSAEGRRQTNHTTQTA
ncbi:hypothetical protein TNCV_3157531 [Trichonephila clavipes]|nr:hypothetical protein TNCV_3157531 [Trichonephila clavipes]